LGFYVPSADAGGRNLSHLASLLSSSRDTLENTIDHGSPYAKSLGFDVEIEWPVDALDDVPSPNPNQQQSKRGKEEQDEDRESYSSSDDGSLLSPEAHDSNPDEASGNGSGN
jgi:hypothetical protein